jgi:fucose 4-O-acetylase-like acetyltransferase
MPQIDSKPILDLGRISIVDAVKGIAIILMVWGHTEQGAMHRQLWASTPNVVRTIRFGDAFIYSFHMPVFFFVSGLFLAGSVDRRGRWPFALEKAKTLLYPYVLWALLSFALDPLTLKFRSADRLPTVTERISGILTGNAGWFLITLFATQLLALAVLRLPHWLQMLGAVSVCLFIPESSIAVLYKPLVFLPFVVAGMWFSANRVKRIAELPRTIAWTGFALLFIMQLAIVAAWGPVNRWDRIPLGLMGIAMLLFLSQGLHGTLSDKVLRWYGEASLGIFVLAAFFQGAARELVVRVLHTTNPVTYLTVITLCAATIPAVLWSLQDRIHIGWLFKWPATKKISPRATQSRDHAIP